jgi:6-phosphofructokinase 1
VPERAYDLDLLADRLRALSASGSAIAVVSEAVGDAVRIGEALAQRGGLRVHATILGHAQRAATPSALDRTLGQAAGARSVACLAQGASALIALTSDGAVAPVPLLPAPRRRQPSTSKEPPA